MSLDWRARRDRFPSYTLLPDIDRYADVFDAIADALRRGAGYEPGAADVTTLGAMVGADGDSPLHGLRVVRTPVTPVRIASTTRLVVALYQRHLWGMADTFAGSAGRAGGNPVLLPDAATLLKRKQIPTDEELTDLARFLLAPPLPGQSERGGPDAPILAFLERHPLPAAARAVLRAARAHLQAEFDRLTGSRRWDGRRHPTKTIEQQLARLKRLTDSVV